LLASGSTDGTVQFVDLDDMEHFKDITIKEPNKKGIFSVCFDNKHNLAYVNEDNLLRVHSLSMNHTVFTYKGEALTEWTDFIPDQAAQFTSDFSKLVFRAGPKLIVFLNLALQGVEKKITTNDKIDDFSISAQMDYLATASYEALETEIYETATNNLTAKLKFESPVKIVQWANNGIHLVYGAGNGRVYLVEFTKYFNKTLNILYTFNGLFSMSSIISSVSISSDSQYAAVSCKNTDFKVKLLNLWERKVQVSLPDDHHTYNVECTRISKDGKFLASCSEDTTVKLVYLR
jgi:WD40 repeat protein